MAVLFVLIRRQKSKKVLTEKHVQLLVHPRITYHEMYSNCTKRKLSESFETECEVLRNIRHRNLTEVIICCSNLDFRALVLEYIPNGSLEDWLYSRDHDLDIKQRLDIMIDEACALDYLHHEYSLGGLVSTSSVVYNYGIMLMETFTRTKPTDEMLAGGMTLRLLGEGVSSQWDNESRSYGFTMLRRRKFNQRGCLISILDLALECIKESAEERVSIDDILRTLTKIKSLMIADIPHIIGWLAIPFAKVSQTTTYNCKQQDSPFPYMGRLLEGLAVGLLPDTVPVYRVEIVPQNMKGGMGSVHQDNHRAASPKSPAIVSSSPKMMSLWKCAIESSKALLLDEICLGPYALLKKVEEFESSSQATDQQIARAPSRPHRDYKEESQDVPKLGNKQFGEVSSDTIEGDSNRVELPGFHLGNGQRATLRKRCRRLTKRNLRRQRRGRSNGVGG
ncbi:LOW QUALITY PROTEIN: hypothetical protein RJ640_028654, partial [Escallonia rubra]